MPRALRIHVPGAYYHVTLRGNHRHAIFVDEGDQRLLNKIVARAIATYGTRLHAYCWMTNHVHMLLESGETPISAPMRNIAAEFARAMQRKIKTTGHFFERRYFASMVDVDSYFMELIRYIHLNPVRAGITTGADQFPWSSHHAYSGMRTEPWVTTEFALSMFASKRSEAVAAYRRFVACDDAAAWSPDCIKALDKLPGPQKPPASHVGQAPTSKASLEELIAEACLRFELSRARLISRARDLYASKARAWIAHQATSRHVTTLAAVARALNRNEATLRGTMRLYPKEML